MLDSFDGSTGIQLSEEQRELQRAAIAFAQKEMMDAGNGHTEAFSRALWKTCADFGILGMPIPLEYGGGGLGITSLTAVMEGLGYASRNQGLLFSLNAHLWSVSLPILIHGSAGQRRTYLPQLCNGDFIGANAASEPDAGSDVFAMQTRAQLQGENYILNGTKVFVTNAPVADLFVVYATIDPNLGPLGITALLVERGVPGLRVGKCIEKMGLHGSPMAEVTFDNCSIPTSKRLGREGRGGGVFESSLEGERGCILAPALGLMRRQLHNCIQYSRRRKQFGKPIGKFQSIANRIVDMKVRLETCRPLIYRVAALKDLGLPARLEASIAKLYISECLVKSCLDAIQIYGGYGYMVETNVEKDLRDAVGSTLYSGTSEIQREIISKCLGL
jgi:alkylation response protein AidB-like acyl-CoA dehydrogenase